MTRNYVVTAAHCLKGVDDSRSTVRVGEHNQDHTNEEYSHTDFTVTTKIHPRYDSSSYDYDVAVIKLDQPIDFQPHVVPICLAKKDQDFTGQTATLSGWGHEVKYGNVQSVLKSVNVPILTNEECTRMFRANGHHDNISDRMLCAGVTNGGRDSCQADSGGPLVAKVDGRFTLAGIVSWGYGCGDKAQPGVNARVAELRDWIVANTDYNDY